MENCDMPRTDMEQVTDIELFDHRKDSMHKALGASKLTIDS